MRVNAPFRRSRSDESPPVPAIGTIVAGWRVVRHLAARDHWSEAIIAADLPGRESPVASEHWHGFETTMPVRELVTRRAWFATETDAPDLIRECSTRERLGGDFVECPIEVLSEGEWTLAVRELGSERSYAELVAEEAALDAGAAITLLVPIVEAVTEAHAAGIGHGALSLRACRLDESGRPSLASWADAVELAQLPGLRAALVRTNDGRSLGRILDAVIARVRVSAPAELERLVAALVETGDLAALGPRITDSLFQWATPQAVPGRFESAAPAEGDDTRAPAGRGELAGTLVHADDDAESEPLIDTSDASASRSRRGGSRRRGAPVGLVDAVAARALEIGTSVRGSVWLVLAGLGAAAALGGSLVLLPAPEAVDALAPVDAPNASAPEATGSVPAVVDGAGAGESASVADASTSGPPALPGPEMSAVEAVPMLVAARAYCLDSGGGECLDELFAPGAPGLGHDSAPSRDELQASEWGLTSDLGDIELFHGVDALEALSVQRTDEGWRLREIWWDTMGPLTPSPS